MTNKILLVISLFSIPNYIDASWFYELPQDTYYQKQEPTEFEKSLTSNPARDEAIKHLLDQY